MGEKRQINTCMNVQYGKLNGKRVLEAPKRGKKKKGKAIPLQA
jgi:hypothetical protein